ncbi:MAG: peptidoglycan DD-metalloendopeptidase family protein [Betaproteobacteria bacterium]|nr:peptidoglycan DD-metalloendopeptidase family protein [Betaproteobacteria bacterium]
MEQRIERWSFLTGCGLLLALAGCSTANNRAPITDLSSPLARRAPVTAMAAPAAPVAVAGGPAYVVRKGDTLYSIALDHGLDYRELAQWNGVEDSNRIHVGQTLRLAAPGAQAVQGGGGAAGADAAQTVPLHAQPLAVQAVPVVVTVDQPQAVELPYSPAALRQAEQSGNAPVPAPVPAVAPATTTASAAPAAVAAATEPAGMPKWIWPADGKVVAGFGDAGGDKGIDIAGAAGQPVVAAADGKVVYSGSGLHGYGNLVIIKHNAEFLTAYAHNQQILVKEGQTVTQGQKIAEMGDSDASRVELHFEIRQMGKPVDPTKYLPERR